MPGEGNSNSIIDIAKANEMLARLVDLEKKAKEDAAKARFREWQRTVKQAIADAMAGESSEYTAKIADGAVQFVIDQAQATQEQEAPQGESGGVVEGGDLSGEEEEGVVGDDEGEEGDTSEEDQENPLLEEGKRMANDAIKKEVDAVKKAAIDKAKTALADTAEAFELDAVLAAIGAFLVEFWWVILLVILAIVLIWWIYAGSTNKGIPGSGGSISVKALQSHDQGLLDDINALKDGGVLVFANGTDQDLAWTTVGGTQVSQLDLRVLQTLKYLGSKWNLVRVNIAKSNGPDNTREPAVLFGGGGKSGDDITDTVSAYATGQAIGIDEIGTFSAEMAKVKECNVTVKTPVPVSDQEIVSEAALRPIYEQLNVDGTSLYNHEQLLASNKQALPTAADYAAAKSENSYVVGERMLVLLTSNLSSLTANGTAWGLDDLAVNDFGQANTKLAAVLTAVQAARGDGLVSIWHDSAQVDQPILDSLTTMFHGMQVANMIGWRGSTKDGCKLWKAYEAREHIRQLVADLINMPTDPMFTAVVGGNYDTDMAAAQVIVYSNEDAALDDGILTDVFPPGRVTVSDAGARSDSSGKDGQIGPEDQHFVGLPEDKGVFARPGTTYIYTLARWAQAANVLSDLAPAGAAKQLQELWNGTNLTTTSDKRASEITYKDFVHIAF